jgi:hypothetical protein
MNFDETDDRFNRRHNSWGSFKKPSHHNTSSSSVNPGFVPESPSQHIDRPYVISLNHNPGESDIGYSNYSYRSDHETSFQIESYVNASQLNMSIYSNTDVTAGYDHADPYRQQPSLCGLGALSGNTPARPSVPTYAPAAASVARPQVPPVQHYASVSVANPHRASKRKPNVPAKPGMRPIAPVAPLVPSVPDRPVQHVIPMPKAAAPINPGLSPYAVNYPRPPTFQPEVPWELPREKLVFKKKIGEGSFGEVWRAKVDGILSRPGKQTVAVKLLKGAYIIDAFSQYQRCFQICTLLKKNDA